jgi:isopropylmalate/homocitrate/citramalate synthase
MTTTTQAAGNGSTTTAAATAVTSQPERITGMAQVREAETYHAASVLNQAVFEAERLCAAIYRAVSDAYLRDVRKTEADGDSSTATQTAESAEIQGKAKEALDCLCAAQRYVQRLLRYEPPF